jgi:hypothetical protein
VGDRRDLPCPFTCCESGDHLAKEKVLGYGPELTRIFAVVAIVSEDEVLPI